MSEYQYYEFRSLHSPLTEAACKEMTSLSTRARVGTHSVSYRYHHGDLRGNPKELLIQYFDVFFYISNWGFLQLMLKYRADEVNGMALKQYELKDVIRCEWQDQYVLLDVHLHSESGFGWVEGEKLLLELLPLHEEIKAQHYQFLQLALAIHDRFVGNQETLKAAMASLVLSPAQKAFLTHLVN